jgi:hypothetical protein
MLLGELLGDSARQKYVFRVIRRQSLYYLHVGRQELPAKRELLSFFIT